MQPRKGEHGLTQLRMTTCNGIQASQIFPQHEFSAKLLEAMERKAKDGLILMTYDSNSSVWYEGNWLSTARQGIHERVRLLDLKDVGYSPQHTEGLVHNDWSLDPCGAHVMGRQR